MIRLCVIPYTDKKGRPYCVAYLKNKFYFVHFADDLQGDLQESVTKSGKPCYFFIGHIKVEEDRIYCL